MGASVPSALDGVTNLSYEFSIQWRGEFCDLRATVSSLSRIYDSSGTDLVSIRSRCRAPFSPLERFPKGSIRSVRRRIFQIYATRLENADSPAVVDS